MLRFIPVRARVDGASRGSESASFAQTLEPERIYLADRNFVDFDFIRAVINIDSDVVMRLKSNGPNTEPIEQRPLTQQDTDAGVLSWMSPRA